jgi:hypothetical protein
MTHTKNIGHGWGQVTQLYLRFQTRSWDLDSCPVCFLCSKINILAGCVILQPCISIWQQCACICWSCWQREGKEQYGKGQEQYGMLSVSDNVCLCCLFCSYLTSTPLIIILQKIMIWLGICKFSRVFFFHVIMVFQCSSNFSCKAFNYSVFCEIKV